MRALIKRADPEVVEEWKWRKPTSPGVPVWSHQGPNCAGAAYKSVVKLTFFHGAALKDPSGLFNSGLDGNLRRAIDIHEGEEIDAKAFVALIRAAVSLDEVRGPTLGPACPRDRFRTPKLEVEQNVAGPAADRDQTATRPRRGRSPNAGAGSPGGNRSSLVGRGGW